MFRQTIICLLNISVSLKWVPWLWLKKAFRCLLKRWKGDAAPVQVEIGPPNLAGQWFCQYELYIYSIGFHVVVPFITGIIHLVCLVAWLPRSLLIPGAGAAGSMTQHVPQAGKLQWENSRRNESPFSSLLHLGKSVSDHPSIQVTCMNLSTFKQNLTCVSRKNILVHGLAHVDFHEGSVSHKLIAIKAIVIGLKVPKS